MKNILKKLNKNVFIKFIKDCKKLKKTKNTINIIKNKNPFLSVCISVYNSEKYIHKSLLSVINQSFQDFEILIINDFSNDSTLNVITKLKSQDNRIKIINHSNNKGIYHSRVEGVLNSRGKYIIFLDPDDLFLNPYLFEIMFNYYIIFNIDIIEFTVFHQKERNHKIYYPEKNNHNHNFSSNFIKQPELSNILFYKPRTKNLSRIICRTVWSKIYKKNIIFNAIKYIGNNYYNKYIIDAEDTILNVLSFQFANNYTNINIPGYLYIQREFSITHLIPTKEYIINKCVSFYLFYEIFYRYIRDFYKDINYLYYDLMEFGDILIELKNYNVKNYLQKATIMFNEIINNNKTSIEFKYFLKNKYKSFFL